MGESCTVFFNRKQTTDIGRSTSNQYNSFFSIKKNEGIKESEVTSDTNSKLNRSTIVCLICYQQSQLFKFHILFLIMRLILLEHVVAF